MVNTSDDELEEDFYVELYMDPGSKGHATGIRTNCLDVVFLQHFSNELMGIFRRLYIDQLGVGYVQIEETAGVDHPPGGEDWPMGLKELMLKRCLHGWLLDAFEIQMKLRGYKADSVHEQRVLSRSNIPLRSGDKVSPYSDAIYQDPALPDAKNQDD